MKKLWLLAIVSFFLNQIAIAQIALWNNFPTRTPSHILDEKLTDISFAFSMRVLESDYNGPIIRLRRASDNAEQDFGWGDNDIVDIAAINTWRGGANVFVVRWYDQSGLGRDAVQNTRNFQPRFIPDATRPYFFGDGSNDRLDVNTNIQTLTNGGINGSVIMVSYSTRRSQFTFGTRQPGNNSNRWIVHQNWSDSRVYFDSGRCCDGVRSAFNISDQWQQMSFVRANVVQTIRRNGTVLRTGNYTNGRCTATNGFGILYSNGNNSQYATNRITEMVMYRMEVNATDLQDLEEDQIEFWNI